jgi:DNA repair exonuclease SbcCD ATPase subunit
VDFTCHHKLQLNSTIELTMDLPAEVEETQRDLDQLRTALDTFQSRSKATIRKDRASMFAELQKSVDSVKTTFPLIQAGNALALGDIVPPKTSTAQNKTDQIVIREHVTQMSEQFQALQASADGGLKHIQDIKKKSDDYEAELGAIEIRLTSLLARSKTSLQNAEKLLSEKKIAVKNASDTLSAQEKELSELDRKMESEKDQRNVAGSVSFIDCWSNK